MNLLQDVDGLTSNLAEPSVRHKITNTGDKYATYVCRKRIKKKRADAYRTGPVPIEESNTKNKATAEPTYGTLDSDLEDLYSEGNRLKNSKQNSFSKFCVVTSDRRENLASCRALIVYFSKLAKTKDEKEMIDLNFVDSLLNSGADINFSDKHGQTILHEISRGWHPHIARFALGHDADINKADCYGRTPLHLAAAVDYDEMVEFLVDNGADFSLTTVGELQTPMHYAAKNNATASLKVMLRLGAHINGRDYKRRTPLFVAAEAGCAESARHLIEQGAPAGIFDSSGTPCLSLMIEKMPQIAIEAVEQFHVLDRAFRKHYYYLSYLEPDPSFLIEYIPENKSKLRELKERRKLQKESLKTNGERIIKKEKSYAKTPLEVIVQYNQLDIIMHPVFQRLLYVKWRLFGKLRSIKLLVVNLVYTLLWTTLGIMIPRDQKYYVPLALNWWRIALDVIGVLMTFYFIVKEIHELHLTKKSNSQWQQWRRQYLEKDMMYCHPRWSDEKHFLASELQQTKTGQRSYFRDPWNVLEWVTYLVVMMLVLTRIFASYSGNELAELIYPRLYAIGLIIIWMRFMKSCRVFRELGLFIEILGSVIADTMKFAFLFFEFFVPYTVAFWILFGEHAGWERFSDLTFAVWTITVIGPFDWNGLVMVDRLMAQILCGTYYALVCVICINLYIALLSDTFARVYSQANANAVMQQAKIMMSLEIRIEKFERSKFGHYMQRQCSPEAVYKIGDHNGADGASSMFEKVYRCVANRIGEMEENVLHRINVFSSMSAGALKTILRREKVACNNGKGYSQRQMYGDTFENEDISRELNVFMRAQEKENKEIQKEIDCFKESLQEIKYYLTTQARQQLEKKEQNAHQLKQPQKRYQQLQKRDQQPHKRDQQPQKCEQQPQKRDQQPQKRDQQLQKRDQQPQKRDQQLHKRDQQPQKRDQQLQKRDQQLQKRDQQLHKCDQQPQKRDQQPQKRDQQPQKRDQQPQKRDQQLQNWQLDLKNWSNSDTNSNFDNTSYKKEIHLKSIREE